MKKTNEELKEEIAILNAEIKALKTRTRLEGQLGRAKKAKGEASLKKAKAIHGRRKASFQSIKNRFIAQGYPIGQAAKKASQVYNRL